LGKILSAKRVLFQAALGVNMLKRFLICAWLVWALPLSAETKVLALAGSTRTDSVNKKLVGEAAAIARQMGAAVTVIDLRDYPMPLYDADLESQKGMPAAVKKLRDLMIASDKIIIASPEYNGSIPGVLKNMLDWTSRGENGDFSPAAYEGKQFAIMSASPGKMGGAAALVHLREIVEAVGGEVIQQQVSVPRAYQAFDANGKLTDGPLKLKLQQEITQLLQSKKVKVNVPAS
jgi:chromate reductase, NAD(P)H dehydrogenase (quinone)